MARIRVTRNTFYTGIINKDIQSLSDAEMFNNSLRNCENFIIHKTSGAYKRPGSFFIANLDNLKIPGGKERIFTWYVGLNKRFWVIPSLDDETGEVLFNIYDAAGYVQSVSLHETKQTNWQSMSVFSLKDSDSKQLLHSFKDMILFNSPTADPHRKYYFFLAVGGDFDKDYKDPACGIVVPNPYEQLRVGHYAIPGMNQFVANAVAASKDYIVIVGNNNEIPIKGMSCVASKSNINIESNYPLGIVKSLEPVSDYLKGVAFGNGNFVACGGAGDFGIVAVRPNDNQTEWASTDRLPDGTVFNDMSRARFINNGNYSKFILCRQKIGGLYYSATGTLDSWDRIGITDKDQSKSLIANDIIFFKGKYIAVGTLFSHIVNKQNNVFVAATEDAFFQQGWEAIDTGFEGELTSVTIFNNKLVAVGKSGVVIESFDGRSWRRSSFMFSDNLLSIASTPSSDPETITVDNISYIIGEKDIYSKYVLSPDVSYLMDDFKTLSTHDNSLLILGKESPPLKLSYNEGKIELEIEQFEITPMSFQDYRVTLYPNFTGLDGDYNYDGHNIGVSSFVTPAMRTIKYVGSEADRHPEINENYIFAGWDWKTTPPILPSDSGDFVCLSFQVPGDTIKYENWWFKVKANNVNTITNTDIKSWWYLDKNTKKANNVNPPGDTPIINLLSNNKFCELTPIPELSPSGADGKPQDLPWWSVVSKDIVDDQGKSKIPVEQKSNMIATPYNWYVSACSLRKGYFQAAAIHENRLWLATTKEYPFGIWGSSITANSWLDFTTGTADGDAIQHQFDFNHANVVLWLISKVKLYVGTAQGIYVVGAAAFNDEMMTPKNSRSQEVVSLIGASHIMPVKLGDAVIFVDKSLNNVREIIVLESGVIKSNNLSEISDDVLASTVIDNACTIIPYPIYWAALADGEFVSLTYQKPTNVMAWARHILGNSIPHRALVKAMDGQLMGDKGDMLAMIVERDLAPTSPEGQIQRIRTLEYIMMNSTIKYRRGEEQYYVDCGVEKQIIGDITNIDISGNALYEFSDEERKRIFVENNLFSLFWKEGEIEQNSNNDFTDAFCYFKADGINSNVIRKIYGKKDYKLDVNIVKDQGNTFNALFLSYVTVTRVNEDSLVLARNLNIRFGEHMAVRFFNTETMLDIWPCYIKDKVTDKTYTFSLDPDGSAINFKTLGLTSLSFCFIGSVEDGILLDKERLIVPERRAWVYFNNITLDSTITVMIDELNNMVELNKLSCRVYEVDQLGKKAILREIVAQKGEDIVTAALDTGKYTREMQLGLKGFLYKYFKVVEGLNHLEGSMVDYLVDGNDGNGQLKVIGGRVTLPNLATYAAVGFKIKSVLEPVALSGGSMIGSSVGSVGRQNDCVLTLYKSLGGQIGESSEDIRDIQYRRANGAIVDQPQGPYTGLVRQALSPSRDILERTVYIEHNGTTSFNVLSITQDVSVADGTS
jgi:hypothetical protein